MRSEAGHKAWIVNSLTVGCDPEPGPKFHAYYALCCAKSRLTRRFNAFIYRAGDNFCPWHTCRWIVCSMLLFLRWPELMRLFWFVWLAASFLTLRPWTQTQLQPPSQAKHGMGLVWACVEVSSSISSFSNSSRSKKKLSGCLWGLDDITDIKHFVNSKGSSIWLLLSQMWIWFCLVIKLIWRKYWSRVFLSFKCGLFLYCYQKWFISMVLWFSVGPGDNGPDPCSFYSLSNEESCGHWRSSWMFKGPGDLTQDSTDSFGDCHSSDDVGLVLVFFYCVIDYSESLAIELKLNKQVLSSIWSRAGEG